MPPREKGAKACLQDWAGHFLRSALRERFAITAKSSDFTRIAGCFLCSADCVAEGEGFEPPVPFRVHRFSSSTVGSDRLGKFFTLTDSSITYQHIDSYYHDPFCRVLNMELLQFYYSRMTHWL